MAQVDSSADVIHKLPVLEPNEDFFQRAALQDDAVHGQRVDQFIGEKTASGNVKWDFGGNGGMSRLCMMLQPPRSLFAACGGALHGHVV